MREANHGMIDVRRGLLSVRHSTTPPGETFGAVDAATGAGRCSGKSTRTAVKSPTYRQVVDRRSVMGTQKASPLWYIRESSIRI
jgi:hypothetical protein